MTLTEITLGTGEKGWIICLDKNEKIRGNTVSIIFDRESDALRMYHYLNGGDPDCDVLKFLKNID